MRPRNNSAVSYTPGQVPADAKDLARFIREELDKIAAGMALLAAGHLDPTHVAPDKLSDGDIRYADGTDWNPGSGRGVYIYKINVWTFLG